MATVEVLDVGLSGKTLVDEDTSTNEIAHDDPPSASPVATLKGTEPVEAHPNLHDDLQDVVMKASGLSECRACNTTVKLEFKAERGKATFCSEKCTTISEKIETQVGLAIFSKEQETVLLGRTGEDAQLALNVMQRLLETDAPQRWQIRRLIMKLSIRSGKLPASLVIKNVQCEDTESIAGGGFADIFRGIWKDQPVALKKLRLYRASDDIRAWEEFYHEAIIWKNLYHRHVLPLLGIDNTTFQSSLCMVLPWMEYGNIRHVIEQLRLVEKGKPVATSETAEITKAGDIPPPILQVYKWLRQIAQGLAYLHSETIVHGDLRGANILIDDKWGVRLTDFGMSVYADGASHSYGSLRGGNARWLSPELLDPEQFFLVSERPTYASDVFSYACCCVELFSGKAPYDGLGEQKVINGVPQGLRPGRPLAFVGDIAMPDDLWKHAGRCWDQLAAHRLTAKDVIKEISGICDKLPGINEDSGLSMRELSRRSTRRKQKPAEQSSGLQSPKQEDITASSELRLHAAFRFVAKHIIPPSVKYRWNELLFQYPQLDRCLKAATPVIRFFDHVFFHNFHDKAIFLVVCLFMMNLLTGGTSSSAFQLLISPVRAAFLTIWLVYRMVALVFWLVYSILWLVYLVLRILWVICRFCSWTVPGWVLSVIGFEVWHIPVYLAFLYMPKRTLIS